MKFYLLFGPPGAGKGTQAKLLVEKYALKHISTGELLRNEIAKGTELGKKVKEIIDSGNLIDDATMISIIDAAIDANKDVKGFLFDGFPRTTAQAVALDEMLAKRSYAVESVLSIMISDEMIGERIKHRAEIENRKDDADPEVIKQRIKTYHEKTEPLISYYKERNKYQEVDGAKTVEEVFASISKILD